MPAEQAMTAALTAGVRFYQYRNKSGSARTVYESARVLASLAKRAGALFIVNDRADIAAACGADGVHLGQDDLPLADARKLLGKEKLIGISTHSLEQALMAEAGGADYIGFGPIFKTATKDAGETQGCGRLSDLKRSVSIPVVAIGGIAPDNVRDVIIAGADGAAIISAILSAPDIQQAATKMVMLIQKAELQRG